MNIPNPTELFILKLFFFSFISEAMKPFCKLGLGILPHYFCVKLLKLAELGCILFNSGVPSPL